MPRSSNKYPLSALAQLRNAKVDVATQDLAAALRERDAAGQIRKAAEERHVQHERSTADVTTSEGNALARGDLQAADLLRLEAWKARMQVESRALSTRVEQALAREGRASKDHRAAEERVVVRKAEAKVVIEHRSRWDKQREKDAAVAEEEAASERWRPKT